MGSSVSPIIADLFMEDFEEFALDFVDFAPRVWLRYEDDMICAISREHMDPFKIHLTSVNPSIKFTHEQETDGKLPFLETLLSRDKDGFLHTTVYRKPTYTNQTLNFESHRLLHQKLGVVKTLNARAQNVCGDQDSLTSERKTLKLAF